MKANIACAVILVCTTVLGALPAAGDRVQRELNDVSTRKVFPVVRAPAGMRVDGQLNEWTNTPSFWLQFKPAALTGADRHAGHSDLAAELHLAWDADALYLAANVQDPEPGFVAAEGAELWQNDSVEILLDFDLKGDAAVAAMNEDDFQFLFSPLSALTTGLVSDAVFAPQWPDVDIRMRSAATSDGYCLEARIPFPAAYRQHVRVGAVLGFNAGVNDNDGYGWETQLRWYPHGHASTDTRARHRIELVDGPAACGLERVQSAFITVDTLADGVAPDKTIPLCVGLSRHIKAASVSIDMTDEAGVRHTVVDAVPVRGLYVADLTFPTEPTNRAVDWLLHVEAHGEGQTLPAEPCLVTQYDRQSRGVPSSQRGPVYGDTSRAVLISDLSCATPSKHLSAKRRKQHWQCVPYETETFGGTLLSAGPDADAPPVEIPLHADGWHAIQLGLWQHRWAPPAAINLALSSDAAYTGHTIPQPHWKHYDSIQEVFWKYAKLGPGDRLVLRHPRGASCSLAFIRLVPLRPREAAALVKERENTERRRLIAMNDCFSVLYRWGAENPGDLHCYLERFRHSDVGRICWELGSSGKIYFQSPASEAFDQSGSEDFPRAGEQRLSESLRTLFKKGIDPIRTVTDYAHELGLECYGSQRMGAWVGTPPFEEVFTCPFFDQHPEFRCRLKDGTPVDMLSYAFPEVRRQVIDIFTAGAARGLDGVNLLYVRGDAFVLYEQPVVDSFMKQHGIDPRLLADNDPRFEQWQQHRADVMTGFMAELRTALEKTATETGHKPIRISAHVLNTQQANRTRGLDLETWVRRGLVDSLIVYDAPNRTTDLDFFRRLCEASPVAWYLDIGSNRSTDIAPNVARAQAAYAAGAAGVCLWDIENLARDFTLWPVLSQLGDAENVSSLTVNDTWQTFHKFKTLGGYRIEPYSPMSGY